MAVFRHFFLKKNKFKAKIFLLSTILSVSYKLWCTVNRWTTQVWTVQFYLQTFFNCKYYCTTWAEVGWICRLGTMDREELSIGRTGSKFYVEFRLHGGLAPLTPWVVWESPVLCNKIIIDFEIFSTFVSDIWPIDYLELYGLISKYFMVS